MLPAQTKFEFERRMDPTAVPSSSLAFVEQLQPDRKVRWFREISEQDTTVEAKTKYRGQWLSVEFHRWGALEDAETNVPYPSLPEMVRDSICEQLFRQTERFRIDKTQIQYSGPETAVVEALTNDAPERVTVRYELVVKAETEKGFELLEFLFDERGTQLKRSTIKFQNTDHLDY